VLGTIRQYRDLISGWKQYDDSGPSSREAALFLTSPRRKAEPREILNKSFPNLLTHFSSNREINKPFTLL